LKSIRVLLVDDHQVVREGLKRMLDLDKDIEVVGEAASGEEALTKADQLSPDVILMDVKMPGMGGIHAIRELKTKQSPASVIVLTLYEDKYLAQAAEAGAVGYLLKDVSRDELIKAIRAAYQGQSPFAPAISRTLFTQYAALTKASHDSVLTRRQIEILRLIASGATNKEIASRLFISSATVKRETNAIFAALNVNDRAEAVSAGYKTGLL
jgi:DNA-binding NarL/FixJ family response regulator